jgi:lycopene cyclase domain-containing protein
MKFTYLLIDFFSVLVPFIFSFHPKIKFYKNWPAFFPAMVVTSVVFISWDMYFTRSAIWGFNNIYLTEIKVGNLPVEEVLFFLCIPYACVFTYACLNLLINKTVSKRTQLATSSILIAASVLIAVAFHRLSYTSYTFVLLATLLFTAQFILKVDWLSRFYVTYLFLLLPFLIVNGLLTGTGLHSPVVWYNPAHIMGPRILTIPVEDVFYGMNLILSNIMIYTALSARRFRRLKKQRKDDGHLQQLSYTNTNT